MNWSLKELYLSFEDNNFKNDFENLKLEIKKIDEWALENLESNEDEVNKIETYIKMRNDFSKYSKLISFSSLSLSSDSNNITARKNLEILENLSTELTNSVNMFYKFISNIEDIDSIINSSEILKEHSFYLKEIKENSKFLLSDKEEIIISKLKTTGSGAFAKQREFLASMLTVKLEVDGKEKEFPISLVRNFAYDSNKDIRKKAYEAELLSYKKIEDSVAFSLNSIKGEVITVSKLRGYESPLHMTLLNSRMDKETLDVMLDAIKEYLPVFRKFYKKKAEILGHNNGLPFYDLFAPVGNVKMVFSYDEAKSFIFDNFTKFSKNLGAVAKRAFDNEWIDVFPREGKSGGAFCSNLHAIGESRILTNFTGSFNDVLTISHELGHAYHGNCLMSQTYLNSTYSMPIAETASTMCETIVSKAAIENASKEEAFVILENDITGSAQVIVDIYSRFLFEDEIFKTRENGFLSSKELQDIMLRSQKEAYGDALDPEFLHPYMWVCKPHYYYSSRNYYNFPYAYGLLFSKGLYALYLEDGDKFVELYDKLLSETGKNNLYDIGKIANIDTRDKNFWLSSLKIIEDDINEFIKYS